MPGSMSAAANPLACGFYTVSEAARLIERGSRHRIYGWLKGYPRSKSGPLLYRDYEAVGGHEELSFIDFVEIRFVEHFRAHGVKARPLRLAANMLRERLGVDHPFARDVVYLTADKADVFVGTMAEAAQETSDRVLESLTTRNLIMYEMIKEYLVPGLQFDKNTSLVRRLSPRPSKFPEIVIDPLVAYGQPFIGEGVPTKTLYDSWIAENKDYDEAAFWNNVTPLAVRRAVKFENEIYGRAPVAEAA